jgi:hypothetical protein
MLPNGTQSQSSETSDEETDSNQEFHKKNKLPDRRVFGQRRMV